MFERTVSGITLTLLLIGMLTLAFNVRLVEAGTITVPDDYPTIQEAINAATENDTIFVRNGTYFEHVELNKTVSLVGEDKITTIIEGNCTHRSTINVTANYAKIVGFTIQNYYGPGIHPQLGSGIEIGPSVGNIIEGNIISDLTIGVYTEDSAMLEVIDNEMIGDGFAIWLDNSNSTTIANNTIVSGRAINLRTCKNGTIERNSIHGAYTGIYLKNVVENTIRGNNLSYCYNAMFFFDYVSQNVIYHNNFINNTDQVHFSSSEWPAPPETYPNCWDDGYPSGGNYWSDYTGVDVKSGPNQDQPSSDGIGDMPYVIDENNRDNYPFMDPNGWLLHQLTQLTITSSPVIGIAFTIEGIPETTPYTRWLLEGSYTLIMPETHDVYVWSHWLEDGDPNRTKTITLPGATWTGVFVQPHGPEAKFTATPDTALTGESIKFDASASLPGWNGTREMPITEYRWNFGGGIEITTPTPIVYYSFISPGIYYATLTVYAPGATPETDSTTKKVTIISIPIGGYSIPIKGCTAEKPLTLYFALIAILAASFTIAKRRKKQQN